MMELDSTLVLNDNTVKLPKLTGRNVKKQVSQSVLDITPRNHSKAKNGKNKRSKNKQSMPYLEGKTLFQLDNRSLSLQRNSKQLNSID